MKQRIEQYLAQFVYGAIDGSVTTFAVVAGAAGARLSPLIIIILGIANLVADGFSMGASAYLSAKSERDLKTSKNIEHHATETPVNVGIATFVAFVVVGLIPLVIYIAEAAFRLGFTSLQLFIISCVFTGLMFVIIGVIKGRMTSTSQTKAALETLLLGGIAAALAYVLGDVLARVLAFH